ncbi:hypothetical protein AVEN_19943-1 [Araneus ventricosus]|uniref:Uncharacterized protein n=1 Tax=Araneus ventricosus TaxID=182803 RepID=A0A4Y2Q4Q9_ARAVE|nr:hypothetical protein AVEN_19943-1 [Araneus ventricosus]
MDLDILSCGQMSRKTPELDPTSQNFCTSFWVSSDWSIAESSLTLPTSEEITNASWLEVCSSTPLFSSRKAILFLDRRLK